MASQRIQVSQRPTGVRIVVGSQPSGPMLLLVGAWIAGWFGALLKMDLTGSL